MKSALKFLAVAAVLAPVQGFAATGDVPFNGVITDTCVVTVGTPGTIAPNTAYTVLSSKESGGAPGTATILATGSGFSVTAEAPTAWGAGTPASAAGATFAAEYDLSGANTASNVAGATATALSNFGTTNVSVDLSATLASGTYEAGTYAATVVVRCE